MKRILLTCLVLIVFFKICVNSPDALAGVTEPEFIQNSTPQLLMKIQEALNEQGYNTGPINGVWGDRTARALTDFVRTRNLSPDSERSLTPELIINLWGIDPDADGDGLISTEESLHLLETLGLAH
nr:peptidoglycan-binding domain-containing protein [uncultured Dongia sp.]